MSIGMNFTWRKSQPKQQKCLRCEMSFLTSLDNCTHCSELNDVQLIAFKEQLNQTVEGNAKLGRYLLIGAVVTGVFLLLSFL